MTIKRVVMLFALLALVVAAVPAMAQQQVSNDVTPPPPKVDAGDTAFVLISSALVLLMTIPGLALFYGGMVRTKNVLGTLMQSFKEVRLLAVTPTWNTGGAAVYVIYASDRPFDLEELRAAARARGATARTVAQPVDEMRAYVADGPPIVLTDQYAPVDNLISILFSRRNA